MAKKSIKRGKHIPQRTCVGCRTVMPKRTLIRIVRRPDGLHVDPTGKLAGRGAYLHDRRSCWQRGLQGALAHALRVELTDEDRERLQAFLSTLPEEPAEPAQPDGNDAM
ncbi:MAG: YlxR family protein [Candidatus Villigracilaceae bacterium]